MISSRYALAVALLLALALVPTVIHNYLQLRLDDGMAADNISKNLDGFRSVPAKRNSSWGQDVFGSSDWIERIYKRTGDATVRLFVARSYDHKRLYHHPELALSYGRNLKDAGMVILSGPLELPVRVLRGQSNTEFVAYALLYGGQFVENPITHQISDSFFLLTRGRKPMTLFYASTQNAETKGNFNESAVASVLSAAIRDFLTQNPTSRARAL